jgi:mono/diheme cytochrome c family protein
MRTTSRILVAFAGLLAGTSVLAGESQSTSHSAQRGRLLYQIHCQNCHGESGTGNGPMAVLLKVHPSDLTQIQGRKAFPRNRIASVIDGREDVEGHGARDMPIWGATFVERGRDEPQEDEIQARILALVDYLETIQRR